MHTKELWLIYVHTVPIHKLCSFVCVQLLLAMSLQIKLALNNLQLLTCQRKPHPNSTKLTFPDMCSSLSLQVF